MLSAGGDCHTIIHLQGDMQVAPLPGRIRQTHETITETENFPKLENPPSTTERNITILSLQYQTLNEKAWIALHKHSAI